MHRVQNKLGKLRRWKNRISFSSKKLGLLLFPDTHLLKIPYPCAWSPWWPPRLPHPQPCAPVCPPPSQLRLSPPWSIVSTTYPWPNWWPSWWTSGPTDTNRLKISKCVTDLPTDLLIGVGARDACASRNKICHLCYKKICTALLSLHIDIGGKTFLWFHLGELSWTEQSLECFMKSCDWLFAS